MEKILIEVYVPAIERSFDVYVPLQSKMHEVLQLLAKAVSDLSNGRFSARNDTLLCERESGNVLEMNKTVQELALENGMQFLLL